MTRNQHLKYNFDKKLGYIRRLKGLSQEELAERADTDFGYVSQIECGRANITMDKLQIIADALDVDAMELFKFS